MKQRKKYLNLFIEECKKYIKLLGLSQYSYFFNQENLGDNAACAVIDNSSKAVGLSISKDINLEKNKKKVVEEVKKRARHEVYHVLIAKLGSLAKDRFATEKEIDEEEEEIVNRLTQLRIGTEDRQMKRSKKKVRVKTKNKTKK